MGQFPRAIAMRTTEIMQNNEKYPKENVPRLFPLNVIKHGTCLCKISQKLTNKYHVKTYS